MSADSAAVRRPDQASAHPASRRAVSRSSGSPVTARARGARSWTQSPWPGGTAGGGGGGRLRGWSWGGGLGLGGGFLGGPGGGGAAGGLRWGGGGLEQGSRVFVGVRGRCRGVQSPPVWLVVQCAR